MSVLTYSTVQKTSFAPITCDTPELRSRYAAYVTDESKLDGGPAGAIGFPETWQDAAGMLAQCSAENKPCVVSGSRTGLTGGANSPPGAAVLSLEKLKHIADVGPCAKSGVMCATVQAGVSLKELNDYLSEAHPQWYFPVDPTEQSASFGGMIATNAAGARSYSFGSVRKWVRWLRIVLSDGSVLEITRGEQLLGDKLQLVPAGGLGSGQAARELQIRVSIPKPQTKHSLGYMYGPDVDPVDLFIGSEGTLGVVTDVKVELAPRPKQCLYVLSFFDGQESAMKFVEALDVSTAVSPLAIEFCDSRSLRLIETSPVVKTSKAAALVKPRHQAAVYTELPFTEENFEHVAEHVMQLVAESGGREEDCMAGAEERDLRDMKAFRHAVPEAANALIAKRKSEIPGLHKIATDMAVPKAQRQKILQFYTDKLNAEGLDYAIFGHAGDAHFHVNLLPGSVGELARAKAIYREFAREVVALGGAVSAEHGLGKIKGEFLEIQYAPAIVGEMRRVRRFFDPHAVLNPGVLC